MKRNEETGELPSDPRAYALKRVGNIFASEDTLSQVELYKVFREYLRHEDDLVNARLNWNFTIQGFLFASYTFSLQKIAEVRGQVIKADIQWTRSMDFALALHELRVLMIVIAAVGLFVSAFVHMSVWAARVSINEVESKWLELNGKCKCRSLRT